MTGSEHKVLRIGKPILHLDQLSTIEKEWNEIYGSHTGHSLFVSFEFLSTEGAKVNLRSAYPKSRTGF